MAANASVGVVSQIDIERIGDLEAGGGTMWDTDQPHFWALIWFVGAIIVLYVIL